MFLVAKNIFTGFVYVYYNNLITNNKKEKRIMRVNRVEVTTANKSQNKNQNDMPKGMTNPDGQDLGTNFGMKLIPKNWLLKKLTEYETHRAINIENLNKIGEAVSKMEPLDGKLKLSAIKKDGHENSFLLTLKALGRKFTRGFGNFSTLYIDSKLNAKYAIQEAETISQQWKKEAKRLDDIKQQAKNFTVKESKKKKKK